MARNADLSQLDLSDPKRAFMVRDFYRKVLKTPGRCWVYHGPTNKHGYGIYQTGGSVALFRCLAHRFAYGAVNGLIPRGVVIRHACDNPICVNPGHLVAGSQADNTKDRVERGRGYCGERHHRAVLTGEQVLEVVRLYQEGILTTAQIAAQFGISTKHVSKIVYRQAWKSVDLPIVRPREKHRSAEQQLLVVLDIVNAEHYNRTRDRQKQKKVNLGELAERHGMTRGGFDNLRTRHANLITKATALGRPVTLTELSVLAV